MNPGYAYTFINYLPMIVFALIGMFGQRLSVSPWTAAYFIGAVLAIIGLVFLFYKKHKVRCFLIASVVFLVVGSLSLLMKITSGNMLFIEWMACVFFALYFLVHLFQVLLPKYANQYLEATPRYPFLALGLYLVVAIAACLLKGQALWVLILIFLVARLVVAYTDKGRFSGGF